MDRSAVARNQRVRMYGAMIEAVASKGYAKTSVADVIGLAGVSRRAFYEHFANKEACFIATHNITARRTSKALLHGWESERGWANRLHASCRAVLSDIERHPKSSHLVLVDVLGLGRKAYDCIRAYNALFERSVVTGFVLCPDGAMCSPVAPRAIVGGVRQVLYGRLDTTRWKRIPGLTDELLDWIACCRSPAVERLAGLPQQQAIPREQVGRLPRFLSGESRRAMAMRALVDLTLEQGFEELTDPQIAHCAGMTTEAFHKQFRTKEQALLAVIDEFGVELRDAVVQAASRGSSWTEGVRLGMAGYLDCIARHPGLARVAFVELFGAGPGMAGRLTSASEAFTGFLADTEATPQRAPTVALEALTGALWAVVGSSVASGRMRYLPATLDHLTFTVLAPYTGPRAAIEAIEEAVSKANSRHLPAPESG
jgi:AcrR family transcriptional regulator